MKGELTTSSSRINLTARQPCVRAIITSNIDKRLKKEAEEFIKRNIIPDCGRVSPNCLKAHLVKSAILLRASNEEIKEILSLFKADLGYKGYYLDAGELHRVQLLQDFS